MTRLAEVVTLYDTNASDIPGMLRQSADSIEAETDENDRTKAMMGAQMTHDGAIAIYGWGSVDRFTAIGILQAAVANLCDVVEEHRV